MQMVLDSHNMFCGVIIIMSDAFNISMIGVRFVCCHCLATRIINDLDMLCEILTVKESGIWWRCHKEDCQQYQQWAEADDFPAVVQYITKYGEVPPDAL